MSPPPTPYTHSANNLPLLTALSLRNYVDPTVSSMHNKRLLSKSLVPLSGVQFHAELASTLGAASIPQALARRDGTFGRNLPLNAKLPFSTLSPSIDTHWAASAYLLRLLNIAASSYFPSVQL